MFEFGNVNISQQNAANIASIPFDVNKHWMYFKEGEPYQLCNEDLRLLDELLKKQIADYNADESIKLKKRKVDFPHLTFELSNYTLQLSEYKRQYLAIKTKGETQVYVQCLCSVEGKKWQEEMIHIEDGGKCYFNLEISLTQRVVLKFRVNGSA